MTTARIVKKIKTEQQIRIEIENANREFKIEMTTDYNTALVRLIDEYKPKKIVRFKPMPTIIEEPEEEEVRLKK